MTFKLNQFTRTSAAVATLACLLAGTAQAASPAAPSVTVPYGDLNLASEQGASALHARVAYAARQVCGGNGLDVRNLQAYASERACESQAISRAVHDVHSPKLAASFAARR
ncbi:MAG: UrcA family protein [Gammaproteobacteria bacterium]|nr:UrcA family protein [Gammaproteobacteria bacterium]MBV9726485.1 UrcA family protein [Gammaproteobacteria bacterium]